MTPFHTTVVPPPLCAYYLNMPAPVQQVAFSAGLLSNQMLVALSDGRIAHYKFNNEGLRMAFEVSNQFWTSSDIYTNSMLNNVRCNYWLLRVRLQNVCFE